MSKLLFQRFITVQRNLNKLGKSVHTSCIIYNKPELPRPNVSRTKQGPITWKNFGITCGIGGCLLLFLAYLKDQKNRELERERKRFLGKASLGGEFELVDTNGKPVSSQDFLGRWIMIYFGFTHCPDICPDELEKMATVIHNLEDKHDIKVQPIFITVDPARDTPEIIGKYLREFSDKFIGLTGTPEQIGKACKAYRVYFSSGPKDLDNDYIVDHTIIMYFVDPAGAFVDYYGQTVNADQIMNSIMFHVQKYNTAANKSNWLPSFSSKSEKAAA